jgi:hypothetical protein
LVSVFFVLRYMNSPPGSIVESGAIFGDRK